MVPKSGDYETLRSQPCVTFGIISTFGVLRTIAFDDQAMLETDEIDGEIAERNLTTPFERCKPTIAQQTPERLFRLRGFGAHGAGASLGERDDGTMESRHDHLTQVARKTLPPLRRKVARSAG